MMARSPGSCRAPAGGRLRSSASTFWISRVRSDALRWKSVSIAARRASARSNPLLRGVRRRNADFRQACSLFDELLHRRIMELPERVPFLLDDSFEVPKTLRGVLLQVRADVAQLAQMRFELTHCRPVPVCRGRPPSQNLGAEFGQRRETLFERAGIARGCLHGDARSASADSRRRCSSPASLVSNCISCAHVTQILHTIQQRCRRRSRRLLISFGGAAFSLLTTPATSVTWSTTQNKTCGCSRRGRKAMSVMRTSGSVVLRVCDVSDVVRCRRCGR